MRPFEVLDVSGDAGLRVFGEDMKMLFANAAAGLYDLVTDVGRIRTLQSVELEAEASTLEGLLVSWLNELIFRIDAYGFIAKEIMIRELRVPVLPDDPAGFRIAASLTGEEFDASRHEQRLLVKAATWHQLKIVQENGTCQADIIFDT
ncbi:MAG: archease [Thermodesulfovibrionales bacterium]